MSFQIVDNKLIKYIRENDETEIVIPEGVTSFGKGAFSYSELTGENRIRSIVLPDSLKYMETADIFLLGTVDEVSVSVGTFLVPNTYIPDDKIVLKRLKIRECTDGDMLFSLSDHITNILSVLRASRVEIDLVADMKDMHIRSDYLASGACLCAPEMKLTLFPRDIRANAALGYIRLIEEGRSLNSGIKRSYRNTIRSDMQLLEKLIIGSMHDEAMFSTVLSERLISLCDISWVEEVVKAQGDTVMLAELIEYRSSFSEEEREAYDERLLREPTLSEARREWGIKLNADETASILEYRGRNTEVYVPAFVGKYPVTEIQWFSGMVLDMLSFGFGKTVSCTAEDVFLPDGLKRIGDGAFGGCSSVHSVTMPYGLESIGKNAFSGCFILYQDVVLPETLLEMGEGCFMSSGILSVSIPASVGTIPYQAFSGCSRLSSVEIADGISVIEESSFENCRALTSLVIPKSVVSIGEAAFSESGLTSITLPQGVDKISKEMFFWCTQLSSVKTGSELSVIGENAFMHCNSLSEFEFPDGLQRICGSAFEASGIERVILPRSVNNVGRSAFSDCSSLREVFLSDNISRITGYCFANCYALEEVHLPEKLKKISGHAFERCTSLRELRIPDGTVCLGEGAFMNCSSLEKLYIPSSVTTIGKELLKRSEKCVIYAPRGSYAIEYAKNESIKYVEI